MDAHGSQFLIFRNYDFLHRDDVSVRQMTTQNEISLCWRTMLSFSNYHGIQTWCEALSSRFAGGAKLPQGVPPVCFPRTILSHDISGSSSSNERFSTWINTIFSVDYDGVNAISVRQREHQKYFRFYSRSWKNHEKLIIPESIKYYPGNIQEPLEILWSDPGCVWVIFRNHENNAFSTCSAPCATKLSHDDLEESASHPSPSPWRGSPSIIHLLQMTRRAPFLPLEKRSS